jgi:hypothetical protein
MSNLNLPLTMLDFIPNGINEDEIYEFIETELESLDLYSIEEVIEDNYKIEIYTELKSIFEEYRFYRNEYEQSDDYFDWEGFYELMDNPNYDK